MAFACVIWCYSSKTYAAALSVVLQVASLAASAGVGGGAFFVPLAMICLSMSECSAHNGSCCTAKQHSCNQHSSFSAPAPVCEDTSCTILYLLGLSAVPCRVAVLLHQHQHLDVLRSELK
jgi:hypothetical protein